MKVSPKASKPCGMGLETKLTALVDKSFLSPVFSHGSEAERRGFLAELLRRYRLVIPFVLIEETFIDLARPKNKERARVARMMARFLAAHAGCWIDDEMEMVFQELVLKAPVVCFPPVPAGIARKIRALSPGDPQLRAWVFQLGELKHKTVLERKSFQDQLAPGGTEKCFKTAAAFMKESIYPFFCASLQDASARREMLETYFGIFFRRRHPGMDGAIGAAFDGYTPETFKLFPVTTAWLVAHFTYMRAPLVKIGPQRERKSLPCLVGRSKNAQLNNDSDERYVVAAVMCDRMLTCDAGMKNIGEAIRASGWWGGRVIYFPPEEDLMSQVSKLL